MYSGLMFNRSAYKLISSHIDHPEAIIITGPRRVGKTTTLKHFFEKIASPNKIFLDIEDPLNQSFFDRKNYGEIKQLLENKGLNFETKNYIFLDEIQFQKNLPSVIKYFYDHHNTKFLVTGSSSFYLKNLFSESLSGRKFLFEMFPLDFSEFLEFKGIKYKLPKITDKINESTYLLFQPLYEEYIHYGGFPQVVLAKTIDDKNKALSDIFSAYFQKEILELSDFKKNSDVRNLILLLTQRVGQKLDIQRVSSELGIARPTIHNFLEFLHGTYLIDLILPFGKFDTSIRKQSKVYFLDTGLLNFLGKKETGNIFENAVYLNLKIKEDVIRKIQYYQSDRQEIDFIIDGTAYEAKTFPSDSDLSSLQRYAKKVGVQNCFIYSYRYAKTKNTIYGFQTF